MKHFPLQFLVLPLFMFFSGQVQAQLKDGYSKLKKGDYETAISIFQSPYEEEREQWGARWGQYQVLGTAQYRGHDFLQAYLKLDSLSAQLKALRKRDLKQELADEYDLSVASITAFKKTIADSCWAEIPGKHNLRSVDSFFQIVAKPKRTIAVAAAKLRDQLRREAANNWTRYRDIQYLYADSSHYQWLRDSMPAQFTRIENALLPAFWDRGSKTAEIGKFFDALPMHPISRHVTAPAFRAAVESGRLKNLLAFEIAYPRSPFSALALAEIRRLYQAQSYTEKDLAALTAEERNLLDDTLSGSVNCTSEFMGIDTTAWYRYIERKTGDNLCGKRNLENMLLFYLKNRQWSDASALLKRFRPLFPVEKARFDALIELLDAPETGDLPKAAGSSINTAKGSEYVPNLTAEYLYFCASSRKDNVGYEDIFYSKRNGDDWLPAQPVRELSSQAGNEAPLSISADGNQMIYFYNGKPFVSTRTEGFWGAGTPLKLNLNDFEWVGKVQMAPNNRFAIFEAHKGADINIYIAFKNDDDSWQAPFALDSNINTKAEERWPFLHPDMKHLYFSSAGHYGLGDLDVFVSTRLDDSWTNWSKPVNLGKMMNTVEKDWGYSVSSDGLFAWFSRADKTGKKQDIYSVKLPEAVRSERPMEVEVWVTDDQSNPVGGAEITAYIAETGEKTGSYRTDTKSSKAYFTFENGRRVIFAAKKDGYFPKSTEVDFGKLSRDSVAKVRVMLNKMKTGGDTVTLSSDVFFPVGKSEINPGMKAELKILGDFFRSNEFRIELLGHTDHTGDAAENQLLSERRAEAVRDLLISVGVAKERITVKGLGETQPVCRGDRPECLARNRRVEIRWRK